MLGEGLPSATVVIQHPPPLLPPTPPPLRGKWHLSSPEEKECTMQIPGNVWEDVVNCKVRYCVISEREKKMGYRDRDQCRILPSPKLAKLGRKGPGNLSLSFNSSLPVVPSASASPSTALLPQPAAAPLPKYPVLFSLLVTVKEGTNV